MASGAISGGKDTDPGVRFLTRIGDVAAPLVRHGHGRIAMEDSRYETARVVIRQTWRVNLDTVVSGGVGGLPADAIAAPDAAAARRACADQLAAARAAISPRLAAWAVERGNDPRARPAVCDVFAAAPPVGHVETCSACSGEGKRACTACASAGAVPCKACEARGGTPCRTCNTRGSLQCRRCYGLGYQLRDRSEGGQDRIACTGCAGAGTNTCTTCYGRGSLVCPACHGQKKVACPRCKGAGTEPCQACEGQGRRYRLTRLIASLQETLVIRPASAAPDIADRLAALATAAQVIDLSDDYRITTETADALVTRETAAFIPVTTATVAIGGHRVMLRGHGPRQLVYDYANIGGLMLEDDVARLAAALPQPPRFPPRPAPGLDAAFADFIASPVNAVIAETAASPDLNLIERRYSGIVSAGYVNRAALLARRALAHIYWADLLGRPALVLAVPLLQLPISILMRSQDGAAQVMAMICIMLLAFAAAITAHIHVARKLQARLAPTGVPRLAVLLDRLRLTRNWLLLGAAVAILGTLLVASLAAAIVGAGA